MSCKITQEGQGCRHCKAPVVRRTHKAKWKPKKKQPYYFEWWFACPNKNCMAIYMVEDAKVWLVTPPPKNESLAEFRRITEGL